MATTTYTNTTFSVAAIGSRTDSSGSPVADYTAEEARFVLQILTGGYLKPAGAFQVAEQDTPDMTVKVGSGTAKADHYVLEGQVGGQGNYIVRLDVTDVDVTIDAADAAQARTDEIYLVVRDNTYDASSRGLPQIGYRKGDLGGAAPGADSGWEAYALLATISVPALLSAVETANITDERSSSTLADGLSIAESLINAKGDLIAGSAADTAARLAVGTDGQVLTADSAQATGLKWAAGGFSDIDVQVFEASDTWTKPAGAVKVWVEMVGGGGGGGSTFADFGDGGGGGAGGYCAKMFAESSLASTEAVTVGAGGAAGASVEDPGDGGAGGDSTFDTMTAFGGEGGYGGISSGGGGGGATGGDVNISGGAGHDAFVQDADSPSDYGGNGGASFFGGGAQAHVSTAFVSGFEAAGSGGGGAGSFSPPNEGGEGNDGIVIVTTYISA